MRTLVVTTLLTSLIFLPISADARHWQQQSDLRLTIAAPESSYFRIRQRHGVRTLHYVNRRGLIASTQWPLIFRIESRTAVGFVAKRSGDQERAQPSPVLGPQALGSSRRMPDDRPHLGVPRQALGSQEILEGAQSGDQLHVALVIPALHTDGVLREQSNRALPVEDLSSLCESGNCVDQAWVGAFDLPEWILE